MKICINAVINNWSTWIKSKSELPKLTSFLSSFSAGVVSKPTGKVAQNREVLGAQHYHGGVRIVWCNGAPFPPPTWNHTEECQGKWVCSSLVAGWVEYKSFFLKNVNFKVKNYMDRIYSYVYKNYIYSYRYTSHKLSKRHV